MEPRSDPEKPFDEHAALAELERVREQIQAYRAQRRDIQDEFGRFTRSFKNAETTAALAAAAPAAVATPAKQLPPPPPPTPPAPPPQVEVRSEAPDDVQPPAAPAIEAFLPAPGPPHETLATPAPGVDPSAVAERATGSRAPALAAAVVVVALLALLAAWMFSGPADPPASVTTSAPPAPAAVEPAPAVSTPPRAAAAPSARGSELTTIRRVWMRVLVDGERVVEREVPADTRIPLAAKESIVIRAGDAGAVKLTLAGEDQGFLGPEGQPVTRTFKVPPAGAPR